MLAFVVLYRRGRYGGPVRSAEWLALGLASLGLVDAVPNLDWAVNAYYAAVGSTERAAFVDALVVALVMLAAGGLFGNLAFDLRAPWMVIVGLTSWWITGRSLRGAYPRPQSDRP